MNTVGLKFSPVMMMGRYFIVIIIQSIILIKIVAGNDSIVSCPISAIVKITSNLTNFFNDYQENITRFENGEKIYCLCDFKTCLSLCPSSEEEEEEEEEEVKKDKQNSEKINYTINQWPKIEPATLMNENNSTKLINDLYPLIENPCRFRWMVPSLFENFQLFKDGSIYVQDYNEGSIFDLDHYCIFRESKFKKFSVKVCRERMIQSYWDTFCLLISIMIMILIFIGHTAIPELQNFHGSIFRTYIAAYIGTYFFAIISELTVQSKTYADLYICFESLTRFFGGSCAFWLQIMSFNTWRSFRWLRPIDRNNKKFEQKLYIFYSIYAWLIPAVVILIDVLLTFYSPYFRDDVLRHNFKKWYSAAVVTAIFLCNAFLIISTASIINRHEKDIAILSKNVQKFRDVDRQWFNLYHKLFLIMGTHLIVWSAWVIWPSPVFTHIFAVFEILQAILFFFIFIWKDNIKRGISKKINSTLLRIYNYFRKKETTNVISEKPGDSKIDDNTVD